MRLLSRIEREVGVSGISIAWAVSATLTWRITRRGGPSDGDLIRAVYDCDDPLLVIADSIGMPYPTLHGRVVQLRRKLRDAAIVAIDKAPTEPQREKLAALCHGQWAGWMRYLFSKGHINSVGEWVVSSTLYDRWQRQMNTPYAELSGTEQNSDRKEADKFIAVLEEHSPTSESAGCTAA